MGMGRAEPSGRCEPSSCWQTEYQCEPSDVCEKVGSPLPLKGMAMKEFVMNQHSVGFLLDSTDPQEAMSQKRDHKRGMNE